MTVYFYDGPGEVRLGTKGPVMPISSSDSGADFYVDASGNDNWDVAGDPWYVLAIIATLPTDKWGKWMERHAIEFGGIIHWANGLCGPFGPNEKPNGRMPDKWSSCRSLLSDVPWDVGMVVIIPKSAFRLNLPGPKPKGWNGTAIGLLPWLILVPKVIRAVRDRIMALALDFDAEHVIHELIFNNSGAAGLGTDSIQSMAQETFNRVVKFRSPGHPGVDAADGLSWALRRFVQRNASEPLPWHGHETFPKKILILVYESLEVAHRPKTLDELRSITDGIIPRSVASGVA